MIEKVRLVVAGVGLVGKRHIDAIEQVHNAEVVAVVDPDKNCQAGAKDRGINWYPSLTEMFLAEKPDGVLLATPNQVHVENGLQCITENCPVLIEKPLATSSSEAAQLVEAAKLKGVPVLVGHHRRHNPLMQKAREIIDQGHIGEIRAIHGSCWMFKPDDYFDIAPWRKKKGAGPVSVNLVHDIDLIRYLCGDIISVQAQSAPSRRGFENEDVASALVGFANGAIGTISVSDTIVSPWSWELTARENPAYPPTDQSCYLLGGTEGSLSLPDLKIWKNSAEKSWWEPISATVVPREISDALTNQIKQFVAVIQGKEAPLVSGEEGLKTLRVLEAIYQSAEQDKTIHL